MGGDATQSPHRTAPRASCPSAARAGVQGLRDERGRRRPRGEGAGVGAGRSRLIAFGRLIAADREHSVLVVGATRSGKTTGYAIPALLEWHGPAIVLSAKTDLLHATLEARREREEGCCSTRRRCPVCRGRLVTAGSLQRLAGRGAERQRDERGDGGICVSELPVGSEPACTAPGRPCASLCRPVCHGAGAGAGAWPRAAELSDLFKEVRSCCLARTPRRCAWHEFRCCTGPRETGPVSTADTLPRAWLCWRRGTTDRVVAMTATTTSPPSTTAGTARSPVPAAWRMATSSHCRTSGRSLGGLQPKT